MQHVPALQGLRAVAVIAVVLYHGWPSLVPGGYLGVDVFFVLSGFLITRLLLRELDATGRLDLVEFYARRTRRLAPALIAVVLATMLGSYLSQAPLEQKMLSSSAVSSLVYLSNFWFASLSTDYLGGARHDDPLLHTWSLSIEEQFYVVWPAFLWLLWRGTRQPGAMRLTLGVGALVCVSFVACLIAAQTYMHWAFFGSPFRAWQFGMGALMTLLAPTLTRRLAAVRVSGEAGLIALICSFFLFSGSSVHPGVITWLPVLATCLVLLASVASADNATRRVLSVQPARWVGDLSYSWYLWHWPALVFLRDVLGVHSVAGTVIALAASLLISVASYHLLEQPIRRHRRLVGAPRLSLGLLVTASVCAVAIVFTVRMTAAEASTTQEQRRFFDARQDRPRIYDDGCHAGYLEETTSPCTYGDATAAHSVVLLGDSHAAHWFPALEAIATSRGWKLVSFTKSACPPVLVEPIDDNLRRAYVECTRWRDAALMAIEEMRPDLLVISSSYRYGALSGDEPPAEWHTGVQGLLARVHPAAGKVVILKDTPWPPADIPTCLARAKWRRASGADMCDFPLSTVPAMEAMWTGATSRYANVEIADANDLICPEGYCPAERDRMIVYADSNHLTATFSRHLAPGLSSRLGFSSALGTFLDD